MSVAGFARIPIPSHLNSSEFSYDETAIGQFKFHMDCTCPQH